jgi:hypothetical protein
VAELLAAIARPLVSADQKESDMQRREYNHASIELANNQDMSGKGTADEISRSYRVGKERSVWCIASLGLLCEAVDRIFIENGKPTIAK